MLSTKYVYKSFIYTYIYKEELALDNLDWLICHETKSKPNPGDITESTRGNSNNVLIGSGESDQVVTL